MLRITIAEKSAVDSLLIHEAIMATNKKAIINAFVNGQELIDYLLKLNRFRSSKDLPPDIVFLNTELIQKSGFVVLKEARRQPALQKTEFYVISDQQHLVDMREAISLGAREFYFKPLLFKKLKTQVNEILNARCEPML